MLNLYRLLTCGAYMGSVNYVQPDTDCLALLYHSFYCALCQLLVSISHIAVTAQDHFKYSNHNLK